MQLIFSVQTSQNVLYWKENRSLLDKLAEALTEGVETAEELIVDDTSRTKLPKEAKLYS